MDYSRINLTDNYTVQAIPYNPPFPFDSGNTVIANMDDVWSSVINLPFSFCYYGIMYNEFIIGSNGLVSFDLSYAGGSCQWSFTDACPSPHLPLNCIFGVFQDLDPTYLGSINWISSGSYPNRMLEVSFYKIPYFGDSNSVSTGSCGGPMFATSQIVFYESTNIIDVYIGNKDLCSGWNSGNGLLGIQDTSGNNGIAPPGRNTSQWTAHEEAWRFYPAGNPDYNVSWWSGGLQIGSSDSLLIQPNSSMQIVGMLQFTTCDSTEMIITDTANVSVLNAGTLPIGISPVSDTICSGDTVGLHASGADTYSWTPAAGLSGISGPDVIASPAVSTYYIVNGYDSLGNSGCNFTYIHVNRIEVDLGSDTSLCGDQFLVLNAGPGYDAYAWSNGSTSQSVTLDTNHTGLGTKHILITVESSGCFGTDSINIEFLDCTGIGENRSPNISIFPNPTGRMLMIQRNESSRAIIIITSIIGARLFSGISADEMIQLDLKDISSGIYLLTISTGSKILTYKLFKD
jgi:hypothetical protein